MVNNDGESFMKGVEKLAGILTGMAEELEELAGSYGTGEEEIAALNAGKTQEEIDIEDAIAARIAAPLVSALDSISGILNSATLKVMEMTADKDGNDDSNR